MTRTPLTAHWVAALLISLSVACSGKACGSAKPAGTVGPGPAAAPQAAGTSAAGSGAVQPAADPPVGAAPAVTIAKGEMARILAAYQEVPRAIDRSTFDVKTRAALLGTDANSAFVFVRDQIANEIYPGVLRGPAGTLQAGAGNDLDKSVLLGALLTEGKHRVRYARCTLEPAQAGRRIAALFAGKANLRRPESDLSPVLRAALLRNGISEARSAEIVAARTNIRAWLDAASFATARTDLGIVRAALGRAGLAPRGGASDPQAADDARTRYWLQVDRSGAWQDLDPSVADAQPGSAACVAAETFDELPPQAYQTITVTIRNEYLDGQALRSETPLSQQFRVSELYGKVIMFVNVGISAPENLLQAAEIQRFIPFLGTDTAVYPGVEYTAVPSTPSGAAGVFDAFGGGASDAPVLAAQWIDFVMAAPGRRSTVSRALVDLVDPKERANRAVVSRPDPKAVVVSLAQSCAIAVSAGLIQQAAAIETAFGNLDAPAAGRSFDAPAEPDPTDESILEDRAQVGGELLAAYALSHASAMERALTELAESVGPHVRLIRDQPAVTMTNLAMRLAGDGSGLIAELSVDLRHDRIRVMTESPSYEEQGFWANALRGLVDGALEHHMPATAARAANAPVPPAAPPFDTSLALQLARSQGIEVRAETGASATQLLSGSLADVGGRRLLSEVAKATAIIAPTQGLVFENERRLALWTIDLRSGDVCALIDTSLRGQSTTEGKLVRLINFLEGQIKRCVQTRSNMEACRKMFQMWANAANRLRHLRNLPGRILVHEGRYLGIAF